MSFPQIVGISAIYAKARPSSTEWQPDGLGRTPVWISWLILVHEYCILIAFNNSRSELLLSLPWMYTDMKNYFSVHHSGARSKGRTRDFNIPNTVDFLTFLAADLTNGLSQQLLATFDSSSSYFRSRKAPPQLWLPIMRLDFQEYVHFPDRRGR